MKNNKIIIYIILIIAVIALIWFIVSKQQNKKISENPQNTNTNQMETNTNDNTNKTSNTNKNSKGVNTQMTYQEAKDKYDGHRIQFDNCLATPTYMTVKNGTQIMLDSRSSEGNQIVIDGKVYDLNGYEFEVVTLSNNDLPHMVKIDCHTAFTEGYNVARVLLQQ